MRTMILGAAVLLLSVASGCDEGGGKVGYDPSLVGDVDAGATAFATYCAACHGADGTGTDQGANITGEVEEAEEIWEIVRLGEDAMAPVSVDDQTLADIVAYMQAGFPQD